MEQGSDSEGPLVAKSLLAAEFTVRAGDHVESLDGAVVGRVRAVVDGVIEVAGPSGAPVWIDRDDIFWADERGVVLALGVEDLAARRERPGSEALPA